MQNTGMQNTGMQNTGMLNTGMLNTGVVNTGLQNPVAQNIHSHSPATLGPVTNEAPQNPSTQGPATNEAQGAFATHVEGTSAQNGNAGEAVNNGSPESTGPAPFTHSPVGPHDVVRSVSGKPVQLTGLNSEHARTRALLISGHRSGLQPAEDIIPAVLTKLANDRTQSVALAAIENVNPDGLFSAHEHNFDGLQIDADHGDLAAIETQAIHRVLDSWKANLVVDLAQNVGPTEGPDQVHVVVRFRPNADQQPSPALLELATDIRRQLDFSEFSYRVSLVGTLPGSLAEEHDVPVVEITALKPPGLRVVNAMIEATVAAHTAADGTSAGEQPASGSPKLRLASSSVRLTS